MVDIQISDGYPPDDGNLPDDRYLADDGYSVDGEYLADGEYPADGVYPGLLFYPAEGIRQGFGIWKSYKLEDDLVSRIKYSHCQFVESLKIHCLF